MFKLTDEEYMNNLYDLFSEWTGYSELIIEDCTEETINHFNDFFGELKRTDSENFKVEIIESKYNTTLKAKRLDNEITKEIYIAHTSDGVPFNINTMSPFIIDDLLDVREGSTYKVNADDGVHEHGDHWYTNAREHDKYQGPIYFHDTQLRYVLEFLMENNINEHIDFHKSYIIPDDSKIFKHADDFRKFKPKQDDPTVESVESFDELTNLLTNYINEGCTWSLHIPVKWAMTAHHLFSGTPISFQKESVRRGTGNSEVYDYDAILYIAPSGKVTVEYIIDHSDGYNSY